MSKVIGVNRPAATPWREDPRLMPPFKPFDSAVLRDYDFSKNKDMRRPFRILSLDGGGIRGILTIAILARISEHNPRFLDNVDFIAGTSVGGIISLLLASGYSPRECDDIYGFAATHIFGHNPWRVINPWRSKYSDKAKQELFQVDSRFAVGHMLPVFTAFIYFNSTSLESELWVTWKNAQQVRIC